MNKNKYMRSFTLVELLSVIAILTIIITLVIPTSIKMINDSKETSYKLTLNEIISAAQNYTMDNKEEIEELRLIGETHTITLSYLSELGYIQLPIKNHLTNQNYDPLETYIAIQKKLKGDYIYTLSKGESIFTILGNNPDTVSCNAVGNYIDLGANVYDPHTGITTKIYGNELPLSKTGRNLHSYSYTDENDVTYSTKREVIINNFNTPIITIDGNITELSISIGETLTAPTATASDICEGELIYTITSNVNPVVAGTYELTYTAKNKGNITETKIVTVNVYDPYELQRILKGKISSTSSYVSSYNITFERMYTLKPDETVRMYQKSLISLPSDQIAGYRDLPISGAKYIEGYDTEYILALNSLKQVVQYICLYNQTTCTSGVLSDFGNDNVQVSSTSSYVSSYDMVFNRIYTLKTDETVQMYQKSSMDLPSDQIAGYRDLPIANAKAIEAYSTENLLVLNDSNQIVQYFCGYNQTTCTSTVLSDFGNDNVQVSSTSSYVSSYNMVFNRIYTLKNDGTVQMYQKSSMDLPSDQIAGYRDLPITNAKAIEAYDTEYLLVLNDSNQVVQYICLYNQTTCTSGVLSDFGTL